MAERRRTGRGRWSAMLSLGLLFAADARAFDPSTWTFPLEVSANRRYLVDQQGKPFRIQGDAAWSLAANVTPEEAEFYLEDRRRRGFNAVIVNLIEHKFAARAPANRAGIEPFTSRGDFGTPNDAYFAAADAVVRLAASKGIAVFLVPMYLGYEGGEEGWWAELTSNTNTRKSCLAYGKYVGARYRDFRNVVWVQGGDFKPPSGSEGEARARMIMEGIRAAGATQLRTGHWSPYTISTDQAAFRAEMQLNSVYANLAHPYDPARRAYAYTPTLPAYYVEGWYESENATPARVAIYWGLLSTVGGAFFGNGAIWKFSPGWQAQLGSEGTREMQHLGALFDALPWQDLVPSGLAGMRRLVTTGGGTFKNDDWVVAAATPDGTAFVAYLPPTKEGARAITVDVSGLGLPRRARWFNPTSGASVELAAPAWSREGRATFVTPGDNGTGKNDWVLVLEASARAGGGLGGRSATSGCGCGHGPAELAWLFIFPRWWSRFGGRSRRPRAMPLEASGSSAVISRPH